MASFCDIFAGTGVVGNHFNNKEIKIISNDILLCNFVCLKTFLQINYDIYNVSKKIEFLNSIKANKDNYFSKNFGNNYFSIENARKIGLIREEINNISDNEDEKNALISSLIYAVDKIANTVGHYDAFRKNSNLLRSLNLSVPQVDYFKNNNNEVYKEDANKLIEKISSDVLYIDPPYNSRQYCDLYHLLENLAEWKKPKVYGCARKMDRLHIKSNYCLKNAKNDLALLIQKANSKHIILSYNNTAGTKNLRSNARINDGDIMDILKNKGEVTVYQTAHNAFTTGKSSINGNIERAFYCSVK